MQRWHVFVGLFLISALCALIEVIAFDPSAFSLVCLTVTTIAMGFISWSEWRRRGDAA